MIERRRLWALALIVCTFCLPPMRSFAGRRDNPGYDRMLAIQRFLVAIYPELRQAHGHVTFQTDEFNLAFGWPIYFHFLRCRPGSGVAAQPRLLTPDQRPCPVAPSDPTKAQFLAGRMTPGSPKFPISKFSATGDFVDADVTRLQLEIKQHPDWAEPAMLDNLKKANPAFGPDNRDAFLKTIPSEAIYQFSGCRLDVSRTKFLIGRLGVEPETEVRLQWEVSGSFKQRGRTERCWAWFEPFHGRLLVLAR